MGSATGRRLWRQCLRPTRGILVSVPVLFALYLLQQLRLVSLIGAPTSVIELGPGQKPARRHELNYVELVETPLPDQLNSIALAAATRFRGEPDLPGTVDPGGCPRELQWLAAAASTAKVATHGSVFSKERPIPFIGTNLDFDPLLFLTRFTGNILHGDFPISHKLVAAGGCEPSVLQELADIRNKTPDVHIVHSPKSLGCAAGWNIVAAYMAVHDDIPWGIISNDDMFSPPGSLKALAQEVWAEYDRDPKMCLGLVQQQFKNKLWSFIVLTKRGLRVLGYFDENIYPAYYEDNDAQARLVRAVRAGLCSPRKWFNSTTMIHGGSDENYVSGTFKALNAMANSSGQEESARLKRARQDRSVEANRLYLSEKWGCPPLNYDPVGCPYDRPFGDPRNNLGYWRLDLERRACLVGGLGACGYTEPEPE